MSRDFTDNNQDINSDAEVARRRSFLSRMERKFELKKSIMNSDDGEVRF